MKIIDLLNKIANREKLPNKIQYKDKIYYLSTYKNGKFHNYFDEDGGYALGYNHLIMNCLNEKVEELIEDNTIDIDSIEELEKFELDQFIDMNRFERFDKTIIEYTKINQLVQAVKQLNKEIKELKER